MEDSTANLIFDDLPEEDREILKALMRGTPDLIFTEEATQGKLYLGGQGVADKKQILKEHGMQVVLQISGEDTPPKFPEDF